MGIRRKPRSVWTGKGREIRAVKRVSLHLQCKNKVSLQNLSMVLRQLQTDSGDEHSRHVMDSVRQAKLAVQMDVLDGRSWCEC